MKSQFNARLSDATIEKLEWLKGRFGTQTTALEIAISNLYDKEQTMSKSWDQPNDVIINKNEYKVWASNDQGASTDVAGDEEFTSQRAAEDAARREMGSGWTIHVMKNGKEVKSFRIR